MVVTIDKIEEFRTDLKHKIEKAVKFLKWDRMKLAEEYGNHERQSTYSRATITQLANVWAGREKDSQKMYDFLAEKVEEKKEGKQW
jgi:hypothetical protein